MRVVASLATLAAGMALALVVAYWGWQLFGPSPVVIAPAGPSDPAAAILAEHLFDTDAGAARTPPERRTEVLAGDARLLGIIAERDGGYALFRLASGPRLVAQGDEISPGATLVAVDADAITVRDGAGEHRFVLRGSAPAVPPPRVSAPPAVATRASTATATCGPPAGFHGSVVRLNTELLGGLAGDAGPWRALLSPASGGLVVREAGGFGAMLGLKAGDRIAQANGIALNVPEDVGTAVIRPLMANQGVRLVGSRDGTPQELWIANVACAG
ncbi:MAG: hypothetical protein ACM3NZ_09785 [Betaproteobacteria bacterium]|jgi:hypothetical protein